MVFLDLSTDICPPYRFQIHLSEYTGGEFTIFKVILIYMPIFIYEDAFLAYFWS